MKFVMACKVCVAVFALALALKAPLAVAADRPPVTVYAAASLKNALEDIAKDFSRTSGVQAQVSYGASSMLARQIENGAPADLFISADTDWMDYLAQRRLIVTATRRNVLSNHLALIAPAESKVSLHIGANMALAKALGDGRLAIAGPDVPAGRYARDSLAALGVWASVEGRLAQAENVRVALFYVSRGEAPLGLVYDTDARVEPKVRIVGLLPDSSHPPIVYPAALTVRNANPKAAAFLGYLQGPEATAVFHKYGFIVLPRPSN